MPDSAIYQQKPIGINVEGLSKTYNHRPVLNDITLNIMPGETFVLMGPSGAGKSVFLKIIMGLEGADTGKITLNNQPVMSGELPSIAMGVVFQSSALFNSMTVFDNLALYAREHPLIDEITFMKFCIY
jgi:phospholipid/cholesterol/gamma-HCH transport system ATP-binding protein